MLFIVLTGLVADGGRYVTSYARTSDIAAGAARAATQRLTGIRAGEIQIDCQHAEHVAQRYMLHHNVNGRVFCDEGMVTVEARYVVPMTMLSIVGITSREIRVRRYSVPVVQ